MKPTPRLSDADARVLDLLVEAEFDPSAIERLSPEDRRRAEALARLFGTLERWPAPIPDEALVARVMGAVDTLETDRRGRMRLDGRVGVVRRLRLPDLVTIAASIILVLGVGWPLVRAVRGATWREQCERNMTSMHAGLNAFARDHDGSLPLAAGFGGFDGRSTSGSATVASSSPVGAGPDWRTYRHGESLEQLVDREYVGARCLTCPGCEKDRGAMALRVPAAGQRFHLTQVRGMLVADANPAIDLLRSGGDWRPAASLGSFNHRQQGQNVLMDDGAVRWLISPIRADGDSIWTPRGESGESLAPGTLPLDPNDIFMAQ